MVCMNYHNAFPFYLGYQDYNRHSRIYQDLFSEDEILEDMEYLQQMYPDTAKKYQAVIINAVDRVDYRGSFIYDQYPDKFTLQRMVQSIVNIINADMKKERDSQNSDGRDDIPKEHNDESDMWIKELVTVLLYNEILVRRKRKAGR